MNTINQQICKNCNICIAVCPAKIIAKDNENKTYFIPEKVVLCLQCGQCMAVCESKAIQIENLDYSNDFVDIPNQLASSEDFFNLLVTRRSVRNFKDKPVPKELLEKIVESLYYAPFGVNKDNIHITVVSERKILEDALPMLSNFYDNLKKWWKNPFIRFMIKRRSSAEQFNTIEEHLMKFINIGHYQTSDGKDNITRNAQAAIIFHAPKESSMHTFDAMIYVTYAILAAHSLGLGATIIGLIAPAINKMADVKKYFHIPEENEAIISLIVGYPKFHYKRGIIRKRKNVSWM